MFVYYLVLVCALVFVFLQSIGWKDPSQNDLLRVEWDIKLYTLMACHLSASVSRCIENTHDGATHLVTTTLLLTFTTFL